MNLDPFEQLKKYEKKKKDEKKRRQGIVSIEEFNRGRRAVTKPINVRTLNNKQYEK